MRALAAVLAAAAMLCAAGCASYGRGVAQTPAPGGITTYVGSLGDTSVLIAWGRIDDSGNTIGRDARSIGEAEVRVGERSVTTSRSWARVEGLEPDTTYNYQVLINGLSVAQNTIRTLPADPDRLSFFVIGDYGDGSRSQYYVAAQMAAEFEKRKGTPREPRFVLTTGDNIYSESIFRFAGKTGDKDYHWISKFFVPYRPLLRHIPFYPTLGNHDGNESESTGDLAVYLDNFFFPDGEPARHYTFSVGNLVRFFALDSTKVTPQSPPRPAYLPGGEQSLWLKEELAKSTERWKIPYFHHPPYSAGPTHAGRLSVLQHWVDLFAENGVRVVFSGHEHNFQVSDLLNDAKNVLYVVSGAGGKLRAKDVRSRMGAAIIAGWTAVPHFLAVDIEGDRMTIQPVSFEKMEPVRPDGTPFPLPVVVTRSPE